VSYLRISETKVSSLKIIHYEHINYLGRLHGGVMLNFLVDTGMMSAIRVAKGLAVIASLDDVIFKKPISLGDNIAVEAEAEYVGNSSVEVSMRALRDEETLVEATGTYVKIDDLFKPIIIENKLIADTEEEKRRMEKAIQRRNERQRDIKDRVEKKFDITDPTEGLRYRLSSKIFITPDMTYDGKIISAGKLLKAMDDLGGVLCGRYIKQSEPGTVVTVAVNRMSFYTPIRLGDIVEIRAGIIYVGNTSIETLINVIRIDPKTMMKEHITTGYFTYVRVDSTGKPIRVPSYTPETEVEKKYYEEVLRRKKLITTR